MFGEQAQGMIDSKKRQNADYKNNEAYMDRNFIDNDNA